MKFNYDLLHDELRQDWVEVACDEEDENAGVVIVCLRELPDKEYQRLNLLYNISLKGAITHSHAINDPDQSPLEAITTFEKSGEEALLVLEKTEHYQAELIARMVVDHRSASFVVEFPAHASATEIKSYLEAFAVAEDAILAALDSRQVSIPFVAQTWLYKGASMPGASPKMLQLYTQSAPFLRSLYRACKRWQELTWQTPQEIWQASALAKQKAEEARLELEERTRRDFSRQLAEDQIPSVMSLLEALGVSGDELRRITAGGSILLRFPGEKLATEEVTDPLI